MNGRTGLSGGVFPAQGQLRNVAHCLLIMSNVALAWSEAIFHPRGYMCGARLGQKTEE